jgi:hypothetical protein
MTGPRPTFTLSAFFRLHFIPAQQVAVQSVFIRVSGVAATRLYAVHFVFVPYRGTTGFTPYLLNSISASVSPVLLKVLLSNTSGNRSVMVSGGFLLLGTAIFCSPTT